MEISLSHFQKNNTSNPGRFLVLALLAAISLAPPAAGGNGIDKNAGASENQGQSPGTCTSGLKHRLAILSVDNKTTYGQERIGHAVEDMLTTEIAKTDCFVLVEREQLAKVMSEQALGQSGAVDETSAPKVGRLLGAEFVLLGSVTQFGVRTEASESLFGDSKTQYADAAVDIKLINVETGVITLSLTGTGHAKRKYTSVLGMGSTGGYDETLESQALRMSLTGFTAKLATEVGKTPWMCYAMVHDNQAYLDVGSRSGIAVGQQYDIFTKGEAIYSPTTHTLLGYDEVKTGVVQINRLLGVDGAIALLVSGTFPENQGIVRRPSGGQ